MYIPKPFELENKEEAFEIIKANPFGILVSTENDHAVATHIPFELNQDNSEYPFLFGHIAVANNQGRLIRNNANVLAIFQGSHAYISSSWYEKENVPTWNYTAIHVYGKITVLEESETLILLEKMVHKYESSEDKPRFMNSLSPNLIKALVKEIIPFKITFENIFGIKKLSQNRHSKDFNNVIEKLRQKDPDSKLAKEMEKIKKK